MYERWQVFPKRDGGQGPSVGIDPQGGLVLVGALGEVQGGGMGGGSTLPLLGAPHP